MELILQTGLEHQQRPVKAVADVFNGVEIIQPECFYKNPQIDLSSLRMMSNISQIQGQPELNVHRDNRNRTEPVKTLNIDVKMETGTGKTYVYAHTMYELHKRYGINKFIIAVPSLPIKAGVRSFLSDPYVLRHFKETCSYGSSIELYELNAKKQNKGKKYFPSVVRAFVEGSSRNADRIYVLLVNMALFTSGKLLTDDTYDYGVEGFYRPMDALKAVNPFVIIDEPHRFAREQKAYSVILNEISPQCIIRYGATFPMVTLGKGKTKVTKRDYINLLYDLDACSSFNLNLIKGVAKEHFEPESAKNEKIKLIEIRKRESAVFLYKTSVSSKSFDLKAGDSLGVISEDLAGLTVTGIARDYVELSNGQEKRVGEEFEVGIYSASYQEQMVRLAVMRHFETERKNFEREIKIKTLALFFIDNIESFRGGKDGSAWLRDMFDRILVEQIDLELQKPMTSEYRDYLVATKADVSKSRAGYFAQDNNDRDEAVAQEVRDILHGKKKLLTFRNEDGSWNTRRFLFSKWTLKEGWDNPNVFTITKLRSSGSENSKLQEVGRGLRLPVDEYGNRISNEDFMLNYIVDFTEADFASQLVAQINSELHTVAITNLSDSDMERVAMLRGIDEWTLMLELKDKGYITDRHYTLNQNKLSEFYEEYPEFNTVGVSKAKVLDRNKKTRNTIKIRKARFDELKVLWEEINKKQILFFDKDVDTYVAENFFSVISDGVFAYQVVTSKRDVLDTRSGAAELKDGYGVSYGLSGKRIPYNEFLIRANKATSVPIKVIHDAVVKYSKEHEFHPNYINDSSLTRLIQSFEAWKCQNLNGRFRYKKANYFSKQTALTNPDGTLRDEIVQGSVGIHMEKSLVPEKYLYDTLAYDSPLERENIMTDISEVVVYGKIPRRSVSIPTITDSAYSPDFMYVVKHKNGDKTLNVIVETKSVENEAVLRGNEKAKIDCARMFFDQLKIDGYKVRFETQLNRKTMKTIIDELISKD